ncbi:MAG: chromate efflux transporter [Chloroflexota bacterium]
MFTSFLRLGLTAFGGPAMIPYIRQTVVERHKWIDDRSFRDGLALCQTIPGATAVQIGGYAGLRAGGLAGAGASFAGFALPAFILMLVLSALYVVTQSTPQVVSVFGGLQAVTVAIIANATILFARNYVKDWQSGLIATVAAGSFWFGLNPIVALALAGFVGLLVLKAEPTTHAAVVPPPTHYSLRTLAALVAVLALGYLVLYLAQPALFELASLMLVIDLFAFGGGFTSVSFMFHQVVDVKHWLDGPTFLNGIALGQITPGPIVITATYVGYLLYGFVGSVIATFSIFLPSFLILVTIAPYFDRLRETRYFNKAIRGVSVSFVGLLLVTTIHFGQNIPWDLPRIVLAGGAFVALFLKVDILWVVLATTVISVFTL